MTTINQLDTSNTFVDWLAATQNLITVANNLIDGSITSNSELIFTTSNDKFTLNVSNTASINVLYSNVITSNIKLNVNGPGVALNVSNDMDVMGNANVYGKMVINDLEVTGTYTLTTPSFTNLYLPQWLKTDANVNVGTNLVVGTYIQQKGSNSSFAGNILFSNTQTSFYASGNVFLNKNATVEGSTLLNGPVRITTSNPTFDGNLVLLNTTTSIYALGNISTTKSVTSSNLIATRNVTAGNISVTKDISASNISLTNNLSVTKSISASNISLSKNVTAGNITIENNLILTKNIADSVGAFKTISTADIKDHIGGSFFADAPENYIDNSWMEIRQHTASDITLNSSNKVAKIVDRWTANLQTTTASVIIGRGTDNPSPSGLAYCMNVDIVTACTSTSATTLEILHGIEGYNIRDLKGRDFVLNFWVKSSNTGNYSVTLNNYNRTNTYVTSYEINSANVWEEKTILIEGGIPIQSGWNITTGLGLLIGFTLKSISTKNTLTPNIWLSNQNDMSVISQVNILNNSSNNFRLSGVSLTVGSRYQSYRSRTIQEELYRCKRYYQTSYSYTVAPGTITSSGAKYNHVPNVPTTKNVLKTHQRELNWSLEPEMRVIPDVIFWNPTASDSPNELRFINPGNSDSDVAVNTAASPISVSTKNTGWPIVDGAPAGDQWSYGHFTADAEFYA